MFSPIVGFVSRRFNARKAGFAKVSYVLSVLAFALATAAIAMTQLAIKSLHQSMEQRMIQSTPHVYLTYDKAFTTDRNRTVHQARLEQTVQALLDSLPAEQRANVNSVSLYAGGQFYVQGAEISEQTLVGVDFDPKRVWLEGKFNNPQAQRAFLPKQLQFNEINRLQSQNIDTIATPGSYRLLIDTDFNASLTVGADVTLINPNESIYYPSGQLPLTRAFHINDRYISSFPGDRAPWYTNLQDAAAIARKSSIASLVIYLKDPLKTQEFVQALAEANNRKAVQGGDALETLSEAKKLTFNSALPAQVIGPNGTNDSLLNRVVDAVDQYHAAQDAANQENQENQENQIEQQNKQVEQDKQVGQQDKQVEQDKQDKQEKTAEDSSQTNSAAPANTALAAAETTSADQSSADQSADQSETQADAQADALAQGQADAEAQALSQAFNSIPSLKLVYSSGQGWQVDWQAVSAQHALTRAGYPTDRVTGDVAETVATQLDLDNLNQLWQEAIQADQEYGQLDQPGHLLSVTDWRENFAIIFASLQTEARVTTILTWLLIVIAILSCLITFSFIIVERDRDVAVLNVLGMPPRKLNYVFLHMIVRLIVYGNLVSAIALAAAIYFWPSYNHYLGLNIGLLVDYAQLAKIFALASVVIFAASYIAGKFIIKIRPGQILR